MDEQDRDERVSLEGLDPKEALRALLKVDPDSPEVDEHGAPIKPAEDVETDDEK